MRVERKPPKPVFRRIVPSESEEGKYHLVELFNDGHFECDCVGARTHGHCRHIKAVLDFLNPKE